MKRLIIIVPIFSFFFANSQTIEGGAWKICPNHPFEEVYTAKSFPSGCEYHWEVTNGNIYINNVNKGEEETTDENSIGIKWGEPSFDNNYDYYPQGTIKVTTTNCSNTSDNGKSKTAKVNIKSIKGYKIPHAYIDDAGVFDNTTVNLTGKDGTINVKTDNYLTIHYRTLPGYPETEDDIDWFAWSLPSGYKATGHGNKTSFEDDYSIDVTLPCPDGGGNITIKAINPNSCTTASGSIQKGAAFTVKIKRDDLAVSSVVQTIKVGGETTSKITWGRNATITLTAKSNYSGIEDHTWEIPSGYAHGGISGPLTKSTGTNNNFSVTTSGCNTSGKIKVWVEKCDKTSAKKEVSFSFRYPEIVGQSLVCSSGQTYTVKNLGNGHVATLSSDHLSFTKMSSTVFKATPKSSSYRGYTSIKLNVNGCGTSKLTDTKTYVWVGKPNPAIYGPDELVSGQTGLYLADNVTKFKWSKYWSATSNLRLTGYRTGYKIWATPTYGGSCDLYLEATNSCGSKEVRKMIDIYEYRTKNTEDSDENEENLYEDEIVVSPNPAKDKIRIINPGNQDAVVELSVFNVTGKLILTKVFTNDIEVDLSNFDAGLYILKLVSGNTNVIEKVQVIK